MIPKTAQLAGGECLRKRGSYVYFLMRGEACVYDSGLVGRAVSAGPNRESVRR